jgi:outer membrane protein OmpA-like peptidoglycan-associated protein
MKTLLLSLIIINSCLSLSYAQKKNKAREFKNVASDCSYGIKLPTSNSITYGPTLAPNGYGKILEIKSNSKHNSYSFEKEHNSAWYYFDVNNDGLLSLKITPTNKNDDYDFLLYKWTDSNFCNEIIQNKMIPVRSNIARTGRGQSSVTGLSENASKEYISSGIGNPFSKPVIVKKGERYYLVIDNVYSGGDGHTLEIGYEKEIILSGTVTNELKQPIKSADVILEDFNGNEISKTKTEINGKYNLTTYVYINQGYNLIFLNDSTFVDVQSFSAENLSAKDYKINNINSVLPKLKKGKKYNLKGLNFYGDSYVLLPQSHSSLSALYKLMKVNKNMKISIEGHINDPYKISEKYRPDWSQELSDLRANTVYEYLIKKGIHADRMSKIGYGSKYMLFPNARSEQEMSKNRRVEINVISIE